MAMFHLRVFSISFYKVCKSSHHLLVWAIFPDLEMTYVRSVNYASYLGPVWNFRQSFYLSVLLSNASFLELGFVRCILLQLYSKLIFGGWESSSFLMKRYSKYSYIYVFILSRKEQNWLQKSFINSRIFGQKKLSDPSLNILCNVLLIWIKNAFPFY